MFIYKITFMGDYSSTLFINWGQLSSADMAPIRFSQVESIIVVKHISNFLPQSNFDYLYFQLIIFTTTILAYNSTNLIALLEKCY
jgi:hypothetical protein